MGKEGQSKEEIKGQCRDVGHVRVCPWKSTAAGGMREKVLIILDLTWSMGQEEGGPEAGAVKYCNHTSLCPPGGAGQVPKDGVA